MALKTIGQAYLRDLAITKLTGERSRAGNPRDFKLGDRVLKWGPGVPRDTLQGSMKALEVVPAEHLNPRWAAQELSLLDNVGIALAVDRVKGQNKVWRLEVDTASGLLTSAEIVTGSPW